MSKANQLSLPLGENARRAIVRSKGPLSAQKTKKSRQRSTLPLSHPSSTIDAKELNFRVRDGFGCGLFAFITGKILRRFAIK